VNPKWIHKDPIKRNKINKIVCFVCGHDAHARDVWLHLRFDYEFIDLLDWSLCIEIGLFAYI